MGYGAVVIPTRVARPKDKPKAELSVQIAQRWVLAAVRHRTFFALADLNAAIRERIDVQEEHETVCRRRFAPMSVRLARNPRSASPDWAFSLDRLAKLSDALRLARRKRLDR
jgi:hypothetical protein